MVLEVAASEQRRSVLRHSDHVIRATVAYLRQTTEVACQVGGVVGWWDSLVARACRATGETVLAPSRNRWSKLDRITGKTTEGETVAARPVVAEKAGDARERRGPCCTGSLYQTVDSTHPVRVLIYSTSMRSTGTILSDCWPLQRPCLPRLARVARHWPAGDLA